MLPSFSRTFRFTTSKWRLWRWRRLVPEIGGMEEELKKLDDDALRKASLSLRYRAKSGEPLGRLLPEAFALVREAGRRTINMRHYDVQLIGGAAMYHHSIVEMQTGEGKTLTATLPLYLHALSGRGTHLATANDYLARRDAEWMTPIYRALGMSVGFVQAQMPNTKRREAYNCDVTYGTAKEFGFDFLRDRLILRSQRTGADRLMDELFGRGSSGGSAPVQRELYFALVDEADSILIDEARTPLIISAQPGEEQVLEAATYRWAAEVASQFEENRDFEYDSKDRTVTLNAEGRRRMRQLPRSHELFEMGMFDLYEYVERAIKVRRDYFRDRHYVVHDDEVVIVDEFTGRLAEGRKWKSGIHQAVEAQEKLEVSVDAGEAARVTIQTYFRRYQNLAGMSGTALPSAAELGRIYKLNVVAVPTNRPPKRVRWPDRVFGNDAEKRQASVAEGRAEHAKGRPILIGTRSIDKSEELARRLTEIGLEYRVLNARHIAAEAEIVAEAGEQGKITVATNMAGRGTDIKLGEGVVALGGLHVICTELHESSRIDRQLIGRSGRQGDPGSYRQYLSLADEILLGGYGPKKAERLKRRGARGGRFDGLAGLFRRAQARVERQHFQQRKMLLWHED